MERRLADARWFSPLDTFEYYKNMAAANGSLDAVAKWSQFYFVPGMSHCGGGEALDQFDLLGAMVNWGRKGHNTNISGGDWKGLPWAQPTAVSLSEARAI